MNKIDISNLLIIIPIIAFVIMGVYLLLNKKKKKSVIVKEKKGGKWIGHLHKFYSACPLLKKYYIKTTNMVQQMYPADAFSVKKRSVETVSRGFTFFLLSLVVVVLISGGDILYMLTGGFVAFVLMSDNISNKIRKQEVTLLKQFQDFLELLRYHYNECNKVDDAIDRALEESPYELSLHIQKIYDVVTDVDLDGATEKYTQEPNNKFFLMFCSICSTIMKQGDRKLTGDGVTVFLNNIKHLQEELNVELLKIEQIKTEFQAIVGICMAPILFLKPIEIWANSNMPELSTYYTGAYGTVCMFIIFFVSVIGYSKIDALKNGGNDENVEFWEKVANLPLISRYLNRKIDKNYSKAKKINDDMKRIGNMLSVKGFYVKRIIFSILCMILVNVVIILSDTNEKNNLANDFSDAFNTSYAVDTEYTDILRDTAELEFKMHMKDKKLTEEELNQRVYDDLVAQGTITKTAEIEAVSGEVSSRLIKYHNQYYKFWYLLITFAVGIFGYNIPEMLLKSRKKASEMDMEDEVIQFQSIALIMMHIKESTVEGTLEWMEKFAKCFKYSITKCLLNIDAGELEALEQLKSDEPSSQFHKIVNSLMSVDRVGMEAAFDSTETERKYLSEKRKEDNKKMTHRKAGTASKIAFGVLFTVIGLYLIAPFAMISMSMMTQLNAVLR